MGFLCCVLHPHGTRSVCLAVEISKRAAEIETTAPAGGMAARVTPARVTQPLGGEGTKSGGRAELGSPAVPVAVAPVAVLRLIRFSASAR